MLYIPRMTVTEAAKALGVKPITIYKYIERGLLNAGRNEAGRFDIPQTDVENFVPPKGEFSRGAPKTGKAPRMDINLECTEDEFQAANIRRGMTARERFLILRYFSQLNKAAWPEELKPGQ